MRTATIRRGKIKTSDSNAPIEQAAKPVDERLSSLLPSEMTTAQLRAFLKANGEPYSGKDRKHDLVVKAQRIRYAAEYVERGNATGEPEPSEDPVERIAEAIISGEVSFTDAATKILSGLKVIAEVPASYTPISEDDFRATMAAAVEATAPAPKAIVVVDGPSKNARIAAAKEEHAALKAWAIGQGISPDSEPKPPTPNLDAIEADSKLRSEGILPNGKRRPSGTARTPVQVTVRFEVDGKPVGDTQNRLSAISRVTAGIDSPDAPRWPAPQLREWLVSRGITDPENSTWSVPLPNGRSIGAKLVA